MEDTERTERSAAGDNAAAENSDRLVWRRRPRLGASAAICAAIALLATGCATRGFVRNEMTALEDRVGRTESATTRAAADARDARELARTGNDRALEALYQAQVARDIALGRVRREEVRGVMVFFGFDKADLTAEGKAALDVVVTDLKTNPNYMAIVSGYTDATGDEAYNRNLAQRRASAVQLYLAERLGSDFVRTATLGFGEVLPAAENSTPEGRRRNRRVEVSVVKLAPLGDTPRPTDSVSGAEGEEEEPARPVF